ncbi:queuosine precursor transporter [Candidatus Kaiserbacteria bacterium]|nr:queuosine precursor transporter [Candidatus Kaiserbacteria bacterium]
MNEALIIASAFIDLGVVLVAFVLGREWLYATIIVNLLLIGLLGAKLVGVFGQATNVGNVFYASVFFATYLILEHDSIDDAIKAVWIGLGSIAFFFVLLNGALLLTSIPETSDIARLMDQVLALTPRVAIASMIGFTISQYVNIALYSFWQERVGDAHWWFRAVSVMMAAQLIDSVIFFSIAFLGMVGTGLVIETMITGYIVKVAVGLVATGFLFASHSLKAARRTA